jgi:general secretion pathway protein D
VNTIGRTTVVRLLEQRVWVQFERRPCVDALGDLFELTGVPVVVDNRVLAQARRPVTATFANGAALGAVLPLVTEMAGLKLLVVGNALYVTSPAHARLVEEEARWRLRESLLLAAQENALAQQWWMNALLAGQLSARPRR